MNLKSLILLAFAMFFTQKGVSQEKITDSIKNLSYNELKTGFFEVIDDDKLANLYIKVHITRAKKENNIIKIADSYLYKSYISNYTDAIKYSDSIINLTINEDHIYYPALGFMIKGYHYYNNGKDKKALDEYIKAEKFASKNNNIKQQIEIKQFIGVTKYNFGNDKEALVTFKNQLKFLKNQNDYKQKYKDDYLLVLDNLAKTFLRGKEIDSALFYSKKGIIESINSNEDVFYKRFLLTSGSAYYFNKSYKQALDSLNKLEPKIEDNNRLAMCFYYKAKIYERTNITQAIKNFHKVDSIYQITNNPFVELNDVYKTLFTHYSSQGTEKQQLESVKKLIEVDSILDLNRNYSEVEIIKKYDIPKLKNEKQNLETKIKNNKNNMRLIYLAFCFLTIILSVFLILSYKKQKMYKLRYDKIISETETNKSEVIIVKTKEVTDSENLNIPDKIIEDILDKLNLFEENCDYLNKGITLNTISKKLDTNSSYLSKIINHYKEQSFSKYLSSLRVRYAINELKQNPAFRNYTISAIAQDVGFNTAESFSKSFFKEKGIYPSYFIKQLNRS